jgi:hypothetical protein
MSGSLNELIGHDLLLPSSLRRGARAQQPEAAGVGGVVRRDGALQNAFLRNAVTADHPASLRSHPSSARRGAAHFGCHWELI